MKLCKECRKELIKYLKEIIQHIETAGYEHEYDKGYFKAIDNLKERLEEAKKIKLRGLNEN